ncbi:MAG: 4Fe-4S binding protein [Desulfomonile tiedjei]|nr:4Fe-4S binding protein [Desulfomonile tiedjei]
MPVIGIDAPGKEVLLMGNEAIARGALEAGLSVAAAYPGNPSSEIIGSLAEVAAQMGIYVEWSINEKVALEVAAAAATSGLNAIVAMKQNGLNVASDFLLNLNMTGIRGGLVLVVCDDPSGISSTNEEDSRIYAKLADLPLMEPATFHEAKDMVRHAFELSRKIGNVCLVRSVTRISHARGNVVLGPLHKEKPVPYFDTSRPLSALPAAVTHPVAHERLRQAQEDFEDSPFNKYRGPNSPELLIITCGAGWLFANEAVEILGLEARIGLLKIGTTWPLPERLILSHLGSASKVLFLEEVDPVLENNVKSLYADHNLDLPRIDFLGKKSGTVPDQGELSPGLVLSILSGLTGAVAPGVAPKYQATAEEVLNNFCPARSLAFCPGCPHRASYWAIKTALALDGRDGVLFGDIGCYGLGFMPTGFSQAKTLHAMGSGIGMASGFGILNRLGATQPALTVCGDSTFYHAAIPALINALHHKANCLMIVLDNSATAMTGFQPHPGSAADAMGSPAPVIDIEQVCSGLGAEPVVLDPFQVQETVTTVYDLLQRDGTNILILRQPCALVRAKKGARRYKVTVDPAKCMGEDCGCNRLCTRVFRCPGLNWDRDLKKTNIDEAICAGCGVCADICPAHAIVKGND